MRDLAELNLNDGGRPVDRGPPSPKVIAEFEREFSVSLPEEYIRLLMFANGGHPELDTIAPMGRRDIAERSVDHFFHLDEDETASESLWTAARTWRDILGKDKIPIATDGGGNPFLLDLSTEPARVLACLHDDNFAMVTIAGSFADFIDGLDLNPDYI